LSNRDIVVIGGSSGASIPLRETLGGLSANIPAIFVVLHVPALGTGILSTLAGGAGKLAVRPAEHGLSIENGHVYLATPDRHLMLASGRMILGRGPPENMARPAVDALFRSAALHYGPRVIGVVLSGLLSDGAAGLSAIKRCGGVAVVQDPADAIADEMPRRALEATTVDRCVPSDRLGDVLSDLVCDEPGCAMPIPPEIRLEVEIALGEPIGSNSLIEIANPAALTCPACGGDAFEAEDRESLAFSLSGRACLHRRCAGKAPGRPCRRGPARGAPHYRRARGSGAPDGGGRAAQRTSGDCANVSGESRRISRIRRHNSPGYATLV
jgi:two-component system, chemotaxis family, protein-glutamate methylesterase/glutaminase